RAIPRPKARTAPEERMTEACQSAGAVQETGLGLACYIGAAMDEAARDEDLDWAAEVARALPAGAPVAALAFDVLSRQGEGRALFAGREFVSGRAEEHGATGDAATAGGVDVASVLLRGAESARETALVTALAVRGLGD